MITVHETALCINKSFSLDSMCVFLIHWVQIRHWP